MHTNSPALLYMGHASVRITTAEGKVIYVDPYSGDAYDFPADLILVTHAHADHSQVDKVARRNPGCRIITQDEALAGGVHQTFDLGYVTVEAVEAGYNRNHDAGCCVGYILAIASNGRTVYLSGDASKTPQMAKLAERKLDYAFFCCDGRYNMDLAEAAECAKLVRARHNIPYHMVFDTPDNFDRSIAERFEAENRIIVAPGETLHIE